MKSIKKNIAELNESTVVVNVEVIQLDEINNLTENNDPGPAEVTHDSINSVLMWIHEKLKTVAIS